MLGLTQAYSHGPQASGLDFGVMLLQLSQPLAAEDSAEVPQKGEQNGSAAPDALQPERLAAGIEHGDIGRSIAWPKPFAEAGWHVTFHALTVA
jgi:hypothetical protein